MGKLLGTLLWLLSIWDVGGVPETGRMGRAGRQAATYLIYGEVRRPFFATSQRVDRGIDAKVGAAGWETICRAMEAAFKSGEFEGGMIRGSRRCCANSPNTPRRPQRNELPDEPVML